MLLPRQWGSNKSGDTMSAPCIGRHQFKGRGVSSRMCHVLEAPSSEVYAQSQWGTWWHLVILLTSGSYPSKSPDIPRQTEVSLQKMFEVWWSVENEWWIYEPQVWTSSWSFFCGRAVLLARLACFCRLFGAKPLLSLYVVTGSHRWAETEKTRTASVNGWLRPVIFVCLWAK